MQIFKVNNWAKLGFFLDPQLGPVIDFNLAQLLTLKMVIFSFFCFLKSAEIPIFIVFSNFNQNLPKKWPRKKTITFHILQNTGSYKKKPFCCNPPFDQKLVVFNLFFFETQNNDVEQKHNLKSAKKNKHKKKDFKERRRQETKKERKY